MIKAYWMAGLFFGSACVAAWGQSTEAGMIKQVRGAVSIERAGQKLAAAAGMPVWVSDKLRTGSDSAVGVTLKDHTLLAAGPNSVLTIDRFRFDDTTHDGNMSIGVRKGTVSVATGKIAKKTPESVDFHTPTTILGVRGTEFVIEVADGGED